MTDDDKTSWAPSLPVGRPRPRRTAPPPAPPPTGDGWTPPPAPPPPRPPLLSRLEGAPVDRVSAIAALTGLTVVAVIAMATAPRDGSGGPTVTADTAPVVAHVAIPAGDTRPLTRVCLDSGAPGPLCEVSVRCAERAGGGQAIDPLRARSIDIYLTPPPTDCR